MSPMTTDNIDRLQASVLEDGACRVTFRSTHATMYHQLYVDGTLAAWTDTPAQRCFVLGPSHRLRQVAVVAVDDADRQNDFSATIAPLLPTIAALYRTTAPQVPPCREGTAVSLLELVDGAPPRLLDRRELWPTASAHLGFGYAGFGERCLGFDSRGGLGEGVFGGGIFGLPQGQVVLSASLPTGPHRLTIRTTWPGGAFFDEAAQTITIDPKPQPPSAIEATSYDAQTDTLTLVVRADAL